MITRYAVAKNTGTSIFGNRSTSWLLMESCDGGETWQAADTSDETFVRRISRLLNAEEADLAVAEFKNALGDEPE